MVGLGGWGKNLLRNFGSLPEVDLRWCLRRGRGHARAVRRSLPGRTLHHSYDELLADPDLAPSCSPLRCRPTLRSPGAAILAGKDVMVEKPMTWTAAEARALRELVAASGPGADGRVTCCGSTPVWKAARAGRLGRAGRRPLRVRQPRQPGRDPRRRERPLVTRRARHLGGPAPGRGPARSRSRPAERRYLRASVEDVVFAHVKFASGQIGHLHLSWLDPHKMRKMTVVGSRADGGVRRHGAGAQDHGLRQGRRDDPRRDDSTHTGDITIPESEPGRATAAGMHPLPAGDRKRRGARAQTWTRDSRWWRCWRRCRRHSRAVARRSCWSR